MLCRFQFYSLIISWNFLKTINIVLFLESHPVSRGWLSTVMNQFYYCQWLYDLSGISRDLRFTHTWVHITTSTSPKLNSVNWRNSYHISIVLTSSVHTHTLAHLYTCPYVFPTQCSRPQTSRHPQSDRWFHTIGGLPSANAACAGKEKDRRSVRQTGRKEGRKWRRDDLAGEKA